MFQVKTTIKKRNKIKLDKENNKNMLYLHQKKSKGMKIKELTIDEMLKL